MRHRFPAHIDNSRPAFDLGTGELKDAGAGDLEVLVFYQCEDFGGAGFGDPEVEELGFEEVWGEVAEWAA
jgi:hypothetical protein